jgi:hypothetical protein
VLVAVAVVIGASDATEWASKPWTDVLELAVTG